MFVCIYLSIYLSLISDFSFIQFIIITIITEIKLLMNQSDERLLEHENECHLIEWTLYGLTKMLKFIFFFVHLFSFPSCSLSRFVYIIVRDAIIIIISIHIMINRVKVCHSKYCVCEKFFFNLIKSYMHHWNVIFKHKA